MKPDAIKKAKARLDRAERFADALRLIQKFEDVESAWTQFIVAINQVFNCLEKGSDKNPRSRQWIGKKKQERRTDELLQYVFQARNCDEHGISPLLDMVEPRCSLGGESVAFSFEFADDGVHFIVPNKTGQFSIVLPTWNLIPVTDDRYGTTFMPPRYFLGKKLTHTQRSPRFVAQAALLWHMQLVAEAERLSNKPRR